MKRMSMEKFRACYQVMTGREWRAKENVTVDEILGLVCEYDWPFAEFYEANRDKVQLYEEVT